MENSAPERRNLKRASRQKKNRHATAGNREKRHRHACTKTVYRKSTAAPSTQGSKPPQSKQHLKSDRRTSRLPAHRDLSTGSQVGQQRHQHMQRWTPRLARPRCFACCRPAGLFFDDKPGQTSCWMPKKHGKTARLWKNACISTGTSVQKGLFCQPSVFCPTLVPHRYNAFPACLRYGKPLTL